MFFEAYYRKKMTLTINFTVYINDVKTNFMQIYAKTIVTTFFYIEKNRYI